MRIVTTVIALASGLVLSTASLATTVVPVAGKLSINGGLGFHDIAGPVDGKVGDHVMAGPKSSGRIVYDDGCEVPVVPGRVVAITAVSPCGNALGQVPPPPDPDYYRQPWRDPSIPPWLIVAGSAAAIGGVVAGINSIANKGPSPQGPFLAVSP